MKRYLVIGSGLGLAPLTLQAASLPALAQIQWHGEAGLIIGVSGVLELCIAIYAIRLARLFGTARVGWSLFSAFLLLTLLHLIESTTPNKAVTGFQINQEIIYLMISILLLSGMAHMHGVLRRKQKAEAERKDLELRMRTELEAEVQKKTEHLKQAVDTLKAEMATRERAEQQIREQARLLDQAHDAIMVHDLEGRVLYWNQGAERIYGWTAVETIGKSIDDLLSPDRAERAEAIRLVKEKGRWEGEITKAAKDGRTVLADEDWTLVLDAEGQPKSVMIISGDITEKRKLEVQTLRLQRLEGVGTLASGIAHDLNNVLTPLMLSVELLQDKVTTSDQKMLLDTLRGNTLRGARLVKQILSFGQGIKGDRNIVKPVDLVEEVKQWVRETFPKALKLEFKVPKDTWTVLGDAPQIHQVLLNLCVNARDAMPNGGLLSIQMENVELDEAYVESNPEAKPGPYVLIKVADTGCGIPKEIQARIFEPFFTTKKQSKRIGLGLSTCYTIVKNHGGFINCYSDPGKGSAFKVYLPANIDACPADQRPDGLAGLPNGHGELILIVDDEHVIREFVRATLESHGYRALAAANGAEAVTQYQAHRSEIAVVFMDMWMPVMDGPSAIEALKGMNKQLPIVGTSGLGNSVWETAEKYLSAFVAKPYTAEQLLRTLDKVQHPSVADTRGTHGPKPTGVELAMTA